MLGEATGSARRNR